MEEKKKHERYPQYPDEREKGITNTDKLHKVLLRMLCILDVICKKYDLDYWLDYGTLLGSVRHQGFIPWDCDIDIGMFRDDYILFLEKGVKDLPLDIFFQNMETDPPFKVWGKLIEARLRDRYSQFSGAIVPHGCEIKWHNGIQLDFFIYDWDSRYENCLSNSLEKYYGNSTIHIEEKEIEYLDTGIFEGFEFPIPIGYDAYLRRCYGDYMQLPSQQERERMPDADIFTPCDHPESLNWRDLTGSLSI